MKVNKVESGIIVKLGSNLVKLAVDYLECLCFREGLGNVGGLSQRLNDKDMAHFIVEVGES